MMSIRIFQAPDLRRIVSFLFRLPVPEATAGRMFAVASRIGILLKRFDEYDGYNLHLADGTVAGQVVMHVHMHVVPRGAEDGFRWNWRQLRYPDGRAAEIAAALKAKLAEKIG